MPLNLGDGPVGAKEFVFPISPEFRSPAIKGSNL